MNESCTLTCLNVDAYSGTVCSTRVDEYSGTVCCTHVDLCECAWLIHACYVACLCVDHVDTCVLFMSVMTHSCVRWRLSSMIDVEIQGGVESYDASSVQVIFRKRAPKMVALLWKEMCNLRHSMHLRHHVHFFSCCICRRSFMYVIHSGVKWLIHCQLKWLIHCGLAHCPWLTLWNRPVSSVTPVTCLLHVWNVWHACCMCDTCDMPVARVTPVTCLLHVWHLWHACCMCDACDMTPHDCTSMNGIISVWRNVAVSDNVLQCVAGCCRVL